jgi:hypothetical protein
MFIGHTGTSPLQTTYFSGRVVVENQCKRQVGLAGPITVAVTARQMGGLYTVKLSGVVPCAALVQPSGSPAQ